MFKIFIDGAARGNPGPSGYGVAAFEEDRLIIEAYGYLGEQTNNFAEYTAMIAALNLAKKENWKRLHVHSDSQLMVRQLSGEYKVKNEVLARLFHKVKGLMSDFDEVRVVHVPRKENKDADRLANVAVDTKDSEPTDINPFPQQAKQDDLF